MVRMKWVVAMLLLAALKGAASHAVEPATQQVDDAAMGVTEQFEPRMAYDVDTMLALHTDDAARAT